MLRPPQETHAYLVGGGIASLTAAVHLVNDASVPASQVHILEASPQPGGSMGRVGSDESEGGKESGNAVPTWKKGYSILAARKLNFSYRCLYETLAKVPSTRHPGRSVLDDVKGSPAPESESDSISEGDTVTATQIEDKSVNRAPRQHKIVSEASSDFELVDEPTDPPPMAMPQEAPPSTESSTGKHARPSFPARLVARGDDGRPQVVNVQSMGLQPTQRMSLLGLILAPEETIAAAVDGKAEIQAHFQPDFFESKFWDVWASLYAFQPWHSAVEFRRYLLRFLHEFANISTLDGIDHAPLNDYECIILPMEQYLRELGVDFQYGKRVEKVLFDEEAVGGGDVRVAALNVASPETGTTRLTLGDNDIVLLTLGSMTSGMSFGGNDRAPAPLPAQDAVLRDPGPIWRFWDRLADPATNPRHYAAFGQPSVFYSHIGKSTWLSFTITLTDSKASALFTHLATWAGFDHDGSHSTTNSNGPLITFRDSPWMMSITMPHQPYFSGQPDDVRVLWGYGLYPDQEGLHVRKPMMACTGAEIFAELVSYLVLPPELSYLQEDTSDGRHGVVTIPCLMPFIGSPFLARGPGDRPHVLPGDPRSESGNLGLLGQFVEIDRDVTFTMEYSARSAQMAVYGLMGLGSTREPPPVHRSDQDAQVLGEMLMTIMS
ncbi:hypothetical protein SCUCBS95973_007805 [Sporothrix curviconia]|uniref:Oleate hydratase n=1 Tax=Sporothrix curviconia TaxID=1260050 RepID=A0ABP0CHP7_9PEZI